VLVDVAGGFQHRTRRGYGEVIRASGAVAAKGVDLTVLEKLVLTAVAYFQPVTRAGLGDILSKKISRDVIAALRSAGLVATGPRSPQTGAPHTYVTTPAFLALWGLASLRDLPDLDRLEEAGLLGKAPLPEELRGALGIRDDDEDNDGAAITADEVGEGDEEYAGVGLFDE
jgi:segregation and condensation protein B